MKELKELRKKDPTSGGLQWLIEVLLQGASVYPFSQYHLADKDT